MCVCVGGGGVCVCVGGGGVFEVQMGVQVFSSADTFTRPGKQ